MNITAQEMAGRIDHTLLRPEATADQIDALCDQAGRYRFAGVCVAPVHVRRAADNLASYRLAIPSTATRTAATPLAGAMADRPVVVSVTGFPLGSSKTETKVDEARRALDDGAGEIDMVVHLGALMAGEMDLVRQDIERVAEVVHRTRPAGILKVILETAALTTEQIALGCRLCAEGEADYVKTSTGLHPAGGATIEHVRLLCRYASPILVKASGGIRTATEACVMVETGAARIGTSSGVAIIDELRRAEH